MSAQNPLPALPQERRWNLNTELRGDQLSMLDDNARFIVRRLVGDAYTAGFDAGWTAGQNDADTDRAIARDKAAKETAERKDADHG